MFCRVTTLTVFLMLVPPGVFAQQTPPVQPRIQATPLPPQVELPPPTGGSQVPNRPITANEAALIALRNQPDITVARSGVEASRGRVQQARSGMLPQLGVGLGYTRFESLTGTSGGGGTVGLPGGGSVVASPGYQASVN